MQVKKMLEDTSMKPVDQLELIDDLQRLGIFYHFENEIQQILTRIYEQKYQAPKNTYSNKESNEMDLYSTALEFRLLREHRFGVSQDVFDCFKNEKGHFKSNLSTDIKGLLQLYEASHLLTEGENSLQLAREFSTKLLQQNITSSPNYDNLQSLMVRNALELPLHWRVPRPNSRWFIYAYGKRSADCKNATVLELAKLDFNIVQARHQEELKEASRWWKSTCIAEILPFARDRIVENYFWTLGEFFEPRHGYPRIMGTKINSLVTTIDDIYDVYGTTEELELFTYVIQRWDIEAADQLPHYMKLCFLALNNFVDEMAYDVLKEQGAFVIQHIRKSWIDLCTTYLQEAKWYSKSYTPRLEEYLDNAWISISAPAILSQTFFLHKEPINNEVLQSLYKYHDIIRYSSMILRFANDLGTSPYELKRGDVPKSIQCYMNETGASEIQARDYVGFLIHQTWKRMNEERMADHSPFSEAFCRTVVGLCSMAQYMYHHGDGHGIQNLEIKQLISSLLFDPIV